MVADGAVESASTSRRRPFLVLAIHLTAVVALTWPLLPHAGSHIVATLGRLNLIDSLQVAWINAHEARALVTAPTSLLDAGIYHPSPRTLFYGTAGFGLLPYFAPTFLATGNAVLALNLAFVCGIALTMWAIHMVVHRWTRDHLAGAIAGWTFLMTPTALWGFPSGAPIYAVLAYVPFLIHAAASPGLAGMAPWMVGALIALQSACDPLYLAPAVVVPVAAIGLWKLRSGDTRHDGMALLRGVALAGVLLMPIYAGYADVVLRNPNLPSQSVWEPGPPAGATVAGPGLPLWFRVRHFLPSAWANFPVPALALALIAAGAWAARRGPVGAWRPWRHCALWVLVALLLPIANVSVVRRLGRGGIVGVVAISLLAGLAFAACLRGRARRVRAGVMLAIASLLFVAPPMSGRPTAASRLLRYPIQPVPVHEVPVAMALRQRRGPLVELPAGFPASDSIAQFQTIYHRRPLLNGYGSYFPAEMPGRLELIRRLPDAGALALLRRDTEVETIVVHARALDPASRRAWDGAFRGAGHRHGMRLAARMGDVYVFDVEGELTADRGSGAAASP